MTTLRPSFQEGTRVWLRLRDESLPARVTRPGDTTAHVVYYRRGRRALVPISRKIRREVEYSALCVRATPALIDESR